MTDYNKSSLDSITSHSSCPCTKCLMIKKWKIKCSPKKKKDAEFYHHIPFIERAYIQKLFILSSFQIIKLTSQTIKIPPSEQTKLVDFFLRYWLPPLNSYRLLSVERSRTLVVIKATCKYRAKNEFFTKNCLNRRGQILIIEWINILSFQTEE